MLLFFKLYHNFILKYEHKQTVLDGAIKCDLLRRMGRESGLAVKVIKKHVIIIK
jgi:hypothetical protein